MRAVKDEEFAQLLEEIGTGMANITTSSRRPEDELIDLTVLEKKKCLAFSPKEVIERIFGKIGSPSEKLKEFENAAILTVDNKSMNEFNERVCFSLALGKTNLLTVFKRSSKLAPAYLPFHR